MRLRVKTFASAESRSYDLPDGTEIVLGRSAQVEVPVAEEPCLSRRHVALRAHRTNLDVKRIPESANPVVFRGQPVDSFTMRPGEFFVIGRTTFHLERAASVADASPSQVGEGLPEHAYTMEMEEVRSRSGSGDRLRLLDLMELPVVLRTKTRSEFFVYACGALRMAAGADWVQLLMKEESGWIVLAEDAHTDRATEKPVSARLVGNAIEESPKPVTYCWRTAGGGAADFDATAHEGVDWAICCAMPVPGEPHVLFYLAGAGEGAGGKHGIGRVAGSDMTVRDMARLVGLVADMVGRAIAMQKLESWQSRLGQFFSDKVVSEILGSDPEKALEPKRTDATVMFFDIGGFSLRSEQNLNRIIEFTKERRTVLNAMAAAVIAHDGVIIAYVGDGMLACWNVPHAMDNHAEEACLAALDMADWMRRESPDWGFRIGLGGGEVVAGWLGTVHKEQYDVLGPVVNQTSRVEGIAKKVGVNILATSVVAERVPANRVLTRRVAKFRPAGMQNEIDLYTVERAPQSAEERKKIEERFALHAKGLAAFESGDWEEAFKVLHPIVESDPAALYIYSLTLEHKRKAPAGWRGVVEMADK